MTTTDTTSGATSARAPSRAPSSTTPKPDTLAAALAAVQSELPEIRKSETGKIEGETKDGRKYSYDYQYAGLDTVSKAILPLLGRHGLAFTSRPTRSDGEFVLAYSLLHSSGEREDGEYLLPDPLKTKPQQVGSAITYARRYCLCAVTGVAPEGEDDDAHAAQEAPLPKRASRSAPLKGAALREHNALRRDGAPTMRDVTAGKLQTHGKADLADPWASVDTNGERQPPGDLPVTYPPGDRQFRALAMHFRRLGYEDEDEAAREERLRFTSTLAGAGEISSSKELTQEQVKLALGRLEKLKDRTALLDAVEALRESEGASA